MRTAVSFARRIADSPASNQQIIDAGNYYLSVEGDSMAADEFWEAIAIRIVDHPNEKEGGKS